MSEPASPTSELLDQLAPGVVLAGRYSLKDRVPRWIAERRFKGRDMESGDEIGILIWPGTVPWAEEFLALAEAEPVKPFRAAEAIPGGWVIVTDWVRGMRGAKAEVETAAEVLEHLRKFLPKAPITLPPVRVSKEGVAAPVAPIRRQRTTPILEDAPVVRTNSWVDWIGLAIALAVAVLVGWFTVEWIHVVREPLVAEKRMVFPLSAKADKTDLVVAKPVKPVKPSAQLVEVQTLRKNGNATSALALLLDLDARTPDNQEIQVEMNSLLKSLDADLDNLRSGLRPGLIRGIDRATESGNEEAIRLRQAIQSPTGN